LLKNYKSFVRQFKKGGGDTNNSIDRGDEESDDNWRGPSDFTRLSVYGSKDDCISN